MQIFAAPTWLRCARRAEVSARRKWRSRVWRVRARTRTRTRTRTHARTQPFGRGRNNLGARANNVNILLAYFRLTQSCRAAARWAAPARELAYGRAGIYRGAKLQVGGRPRRQFNAGCGCQQSRSFSHADPRAHVCLDAQVVRANEITRVTWRRASSVCSRAHVCGQIVVVRRQFKAAPPCRRPGARVPAPQCARTSGAKLVNGRQAGRARRRGAAEAPPRRARPRPDYRRRARLGGARLSRPLAGAGGAPPN